MASIRHCLILDYPNVDDVKRNQTFLRGSTVSVECNSYPGQPELPLLWIRNDRGIETDPSSRVRQDGNQVVINNIREDDSGIYQCGYISAIGFISASINVNVVGYIVTEA